MMQMHQAELFVCGLCFSWITGTNWHPKCILEASMQEDEDDESEEHRLSDQVQNERKKDGVHVTDVTDVR